MSTTIRTATEAATPATGFSAQIGATLFRVRLALIARRQRRSLLALDDRMLADIGISRSQAYGEATRSLFDVSNRTR
jgi:uncharacterized protein YjiS (DUF1127 family)